MNLQQRSKGTVAILRPIDDIMFEVLAKNPCLVEEILRTILKDPALKVVRSDVQESLKNLYGRSVRLDVLCELGDGRYSNVEVQKSDNDDHVRRVRYNASCITANITDPGTHFQEVKDLIMIYISTFDMFGGGRTIYHAKTYIEEMSEYADNGLEEIYVNTKINDGTDIAELMQCFLQEKVDNPKFPVLSAEMKHYKETEEGVTHMCEAVEKYAQEYAKEYAQEYAKEYAEKAKAEARAEGKVEGKAEGKAEGISETVNKLYQKGNSVEQIVDMLDMSIDEVQQYIKK